MSFISNGTFGPDSHPTYRLPASWALHGYNYEAELSYAGGPQRLALRPGMVSLTPPGVTTVYRWRHAGSTHACAHFVLPAPAADSLTVPLVLDLGAGYAECHDRMQAAIGYFPASPRRADAVLWSILWSLAEWRSGGDRAVTGHPALRMATGHIERHLGDPRLTVRQVVGSAGISHNHLTRLFGSAYGTGVLGYIHQRRVARAERLLRETALPVKAVAAEVGVPDLQRFNKLVHSQRGCSPRALRTR